MINPTFTDTVTVYHQHKYLDEATNRNVTEWIRTVINNCFFASEEVESTNGTNLSLANKYTVRIDKNEVPDGFAVESGDVVVKGNVTDTITDTAGSRISDFIIKYRPDCFTVQAVAKNFKNYGAHYRVTGV